MSMPIRVVSARLNYSRSSRKCPQSGISHHGPPASLTITLYLQLASHISQLFSHDDLTCPNQPKANQERHPPLPRSLLYAHQLSTAIIKPPSTPHHPISARRNMSKRYIPKRAILSYFLSVTREPHFLTKHPRARHSMKPKNKNPKISTINPRNPFLLLRRVEK